MQKNFSVNLNKFSSVTLYNFYFLGACDGLGAKFKREAYKASLIAKASNAILKPQPLFEWGKSFFKTLNVSFYDKTLHKKMQRILNKRFNEAVAVPQILRNHGFIVKSENTVIIKRYSNSSEGVEWNI